jgi:hypothetical protein
MGVAPNGAVQPNGTDFWWPSYPGNTGNWWWDNVAAPGHSVTTSPILLPDCAGGKDPGSSIGTGSANEAELTGCLVGFTTDSYPNGNSTLCDWTKTPAKPGGSSASAADGSEIARTRQREFVSLCNALPQNRTCAPFVGSTMAANTWTSSSNVRSVDFNGAWARRALGLYTCRDWNRADTRLRTRLLARLSRWTSGPVEGDSLIGYGTVLPDSRAAAMFDNRCQPSYAKSFALYKLYGPAAGGAGVSP